MATYHVATTGSNAADGSPGTPWLTPAYAVAHVSSADTVEIHTGTYTANLIDSELGAVVSGITVKAAAGETVILQPAAGDLQAIRLTSGQHDITFLDLILDGINNAVPSSGADLVYLSGGASRNLFLNLEVKRNASSGYQFAVTADSNQIIGGSMHGNGRLNVGNSGYGLYLKGNFNLVQGVDIYENNGYGVHMNPGSLSGGRANRIIGNRFRLNAVHGAPGTGGSTSYAIECSGSDGNQITNNLIYGNQGGILLYGGRTTVAVNTLIYNNTIYGNTNIGLAMQYYGAGNVVANNLIYGNGQDLVDYGGSGTVTLTSNLAGINPLFTDAPSGDFTLQAASPAIDAGTTAGHVTDDYAGGARGTGGGGGRTDIGAYEYGSTPAPDAPPARPPDPRDPSAPCCQTKPQAPGTPSVGPIVTKTGGGLPRAVNPSAWEQFCEGDGAVPSAADATDAESWIS